MRRGGPACRLAELFPEGPDAVLVGPGEVLRLDPPGDAARRAEAGAYPPGADLWFLPTLAARRWRVPVLWSAPAVPSPLPAAAGPALRLAARGARYRSVRDPVSLELLRDSGVDGPVRLAPDPRLLAGQEPGDRALRTVWAEVVGEW